MAKYTISVTVNGDHYRARRNDVKKAWSLFYRKARKGMDVSLWDEESVLAISDSKICKKCWTPKTGADIFDEGKVFTEKESRRNRVIEKFYGKKSWECPAKAIVWTEQ